RRHAEIGGDELDGFLRQPALFVLRDGECGDHRRLPVLRRILRDRLVDPGERLRAQDHRCVHRSISPNTMSCVPIMATMSAIMWPRDISSSAARCAKPGARIFM